MSVKTEYDLDGSIGISVDADNFLKIEPGEEEPLVDIDIDIKVEFPYQPVQLQLSSHHHQDDEHLQYNSLEFTDPLESGQDYNEPISEPKPDSNPSFLWAPVSTLKKLKKISTAICTKCNLGFPSPFLFEQHMIEIHQDDRPYPCKHCGKPFATVPQQKVHETIHNPKRFQGEPQFSCDICSKSYHLKRSLQGHKLKIHAGYKPPKRSSSAPVIEHHSTNGVKNPNGYRKPKQVHSCPHCDLTFDMKCHLQKHMIVHTKERPFSCPICQESFPRKMTLKTHIKNIHENPTSRTPIRPKWQAKQPCPCTICGKIFPLPSWLSKHMLLHTGEKPYSCTTCSKKFRTKGDLNYHIKQSHIKDQLVVNPLKLFKCRVCGKNDFVFFRDLRQHRKGVHRNIPYESEQEKPFACGICGKPHFLREGALICAVLGHDAGPLRKDMFKVKCPECPEGELFGYHNVLALRRHWEKEHGDKKLPARFRQGLNGEKELKDELPNCRIDRVKRELIQKNGPDLEQVESEVPLYIDLDLLEVPEDERFFKRTKEKLKRVVKNVEQICGICGLRLSNKLNLSRHVKVVHDPRRKFQNKFYECKMCGKIFRKFGVFKNHERKCHVNKKGRRKVGRPKKNILEKINRKNEDVTEILINGNNIGLGNGNTSVNIEKPGAVQAILNFQTVTVHLKRINFNIIK